MKASRIALTAGLAVLMAGGTAGQAEEAAAALAADSTHAGMHAGTDKAPAWFEKVKASCWVDAYYQYNFNGKSATGPLGRAFDVKQQEFSFSGAQFSMSRTDEASGTSGQLDLLTGPIAALVQPALGASSILVKQAFVGQTFGSLALKMGKFVTYLGTEVIDTPLNLNYSRSNLFLQIPYNHVGLSANYTVMEGLGLMAFVGNGNTVDVAVNEYKDYGAQVSYSGIEGLTTYFNYYMESKFTDAFGAANSVSENLHYFQLLMSYQAMEKLGVSAEYLYKTQIAASDTNAAGNLVTGSVMLDPATAKLVAFSPKMQGYALYFNYATPIEGLSIIPRYEQWFTPDTTPYPVDDLTLTGKYVKGPLVHALEFRADTTTPPAFPPANGQTALLYSQMTLTYGVTYTF